MQPLRQGDVLLIPASKTVKDTKLPHLTLAEGEVTGHRHRNGCWKNRTQNFGAS